jgi:hypothetical protein
VAELAKPRALPRGGTIGIAAPASAVDLEVLAAGEKRWREAGFAVVQRDDIGARRRYLAGDDARRAAELAAFWADPRIDAIVCARGGWGCHRIMDRLDAAAVRAARKPLAGYSDVTTLLLWQRRFAGLAGVHGPMLERTLDDAEFGSLVEMLTGTERLPVVRPGSTGAGCRRAARGGSLAARGIMRTPWAVDDRRVLLPKTRRAAVSHRPPARAAALRGRLRARHAGIGLGRFEGCDEPDGGHRPRGLAEVRRIGVPCVKACRSATARTCLAVRARALDGDRPRCKFSGGVA